MEDRTMIYVVDQNQSNGDIVDRFYFGSYRTMQAWLLQHNVPILSKHGQGKYTFPDGTSYEYGAWPGGSETDYDVYDAYDGTLLWKGLNSDE
jgi:hypothetical protein